MKKLLVLILGLTLLTATSGLIGCEAPEHGKTKVPAGHETSEVVKEALKTKEEIFKALEFLEEQRGHKTPEKHSEH